MAREEGGVAATVIVSFVLGAITGAAVALLVAPASGEEMRRIVGYLWSVQFFDPKGNAGAGKRVFEQKHCATCHTSGPAPKIAGGDIHSFQMVSALWAHGPNMLDEMRKKKVEWPRFRDAEMSNLVAFLNSK